MNGTVLHLLQQKKYWLFPKILSALGIESSWESQSYSKKFFTELYRNVACKFPNFVHLKMKIKLKWISRVKCDEFIPKWNRIKLKCIYILFYFILLAQLRGAAIKTRKNFTLYVKGENKTGIFKEYPLSLWKHCKDVQLG